MDYVRLREEGVRLLGRLAGAQWTDFNAHDPGITILEQLCYAITDLGYRTAYPVPELLHRGGLGLPGPEAILTTDPVTADDVRKLALDTEGVGNAWVEELDELELEFFYHPGSGELRLGADRAEPEATAVRLRGIQCVMVQAAESSTVEEALHRAGMRLHAARALGSDIELAPVRTFPIEVVAAIEVAAVDDPAGLMADILHQIEDYLAPRPRFIPRTKAVASGRPLEETFEGPPLHHGVIDGLRASRRNVYVSDLLHAILDVPAVKAVRSLILEVGEDVHHWALEIPAGHIPVLLDAPEELTRQVTLLRNELPIGVNAEALKERLAERRSADARPPSEDTAAAPAPPRDLTRYRSIQYQLPAAYGVGALGLPGSASPERRAQARQLSGYLLFFDQLLANSLAQLAHAGELLSAEGELDRSYFAGSIEDPRLGLDELRGDPVEHQDRLEKQVESRSALERRQRFLAHLLARFGEELGDHALLETADDPDAADSDLASAKAKALVADRRAFLRALTKWEGPRLRRETDGEHRTLSARRGSGYDVFHYGSSADAGGFAERLGHKLGLHGRGRVHVVEHILLRPLAEDRGQLAGEGEPEVPLLDEVEGPDPWSLQVSVVLEERPDQDGAGFEAFVAQTIRAELPVHLTAHLHWFGEGEDSDSWAEFEAAWEDFRAAYRDYRKAKLELREVPALLQLRVRDARDRVIDRLGLGRTYPLRDLPLPEQIVVPPGMRGRIPLPFSQPGVSYELHDRFGARVDALAVIGTGGPIELVTPEIHADISFRILAVKSASEAWLRTMVRVIEGVDAAVVAQIRLPLLDSSIDDPGPSDARIGDWGVEAEVEVLESQEGVTYKLIQDAPDLSDPSKDVPASPHVEVGTSGTIVLRTEPIEEDVDLRVRATRATGDPANPVMRTAVLDGVLPLRVRAKRSVIAQAAPAIVPYEGSSTVRLEATQESASYQLSRARVPDRDFFPVAGEATIDVDVDGWMVRLRRPASSAVWQELRGFSPVGAPVAGTGGLLELPIGVPATEDSFLLVRASKRHQRGPLETGAPEIESAVQLDEAVALLVGPNPAQPLRLRAIFEGETIGALRVERGQPGVFYQFRIDGEEEPIAPPAYFHQRDDTDERLNKGIDQLAVEVDFVVRRGGEGFDPAATPPPPPLLETAPLPAGSVLAVFARKAMSGLEAPLDRRAILDAVPAVIADPAVVEPGASATIVIEVSREGEQYWLERQSERVGDATAGTGGRLALPTGPLDESAVLTVVIARTDAAGLDVERQLEVAVDVG